MISPTHPTNLNLHRLQDSPSDPPILDIMTPKRTMRAPKLMRAQHLPHMRNLVGRQRDHVGDAPHEGKRVHALGPPKMPLTPRNPLSVSRPAAQARGRRHQRIGDEQSPVEQQDEAAGEVPTQLQGFRARGQDVRHGLALWNQDLALGVPLRQPLAVLGGEVDVAVEGAGPEEVGGVVVRVGYHDGLYPAQVIDAVDSRFVQECDAVPQDVAHRRLDQRAALADAYFRLGVYEGDAVVVLILVEDVFVGILGGLGG